MVAMMKKLTVLALAVTTCTATAFIPSTSIKTYNGKAATASAKQVPAALNAQR